MSNKLDVITKLSPLFWSYIVPPGVDNYDGDAKEFKITAVQDAETAKTLIAEITALYEANTKDGFNCKTMGWKACTSTGRFDKTGDHYLFKFHTKAFFEGRETIIKTYNASGKQVDMGGKQIGNGSTGAIEGQIRYYSYSKSKEDGISLFLKAVQVKEFVEYVKKEPEFGKHEGFVGDAGVLDVPTPQPSGFMDHNIPPHGELLEL